MTWLRPLDNLGSADLSAVGYKAYYLGQLQQWQLPVAEGWVLSAKAWQTYFNQVARADQAWGKQLAQLDSPAFEGLQQTSQALQRAAQATPLPERLVAELTQWSATLGVLPQTGGWMLRSSLGPAPGGNAPVAATTNSAALAEGVLPAYLMAVGNPAWPQALQRFWQQALTASSLVVWQHHGVELHQLRLATLIMPVYPALVSGTLSFAAGVATVEAVQGLGLALSRGEAMPARCRVDLAQRLPIAWETGCQEQVYQLVAAPSPAAPPVVTGAITAAKTSGLQVIRRDYPELPAPLAPDQLHQLVQLADQAQQRLGQSGVQLEWLLAPGPGGEAPRLVITQASPFVADLGVSVDIPSSPKATATGRTDPARTLARPKLPAVSTVVQGIGASSGRIQGVALVATCPGELPNPLPPGAIVVLPDLQPDVFLQLQAVAGIVTERGGATCHAAILAREMGVPAVVGAPQATQLLRGETAIWLDGDRGIVYGLGDAVLMPASPLRGPIAALTPAISTELAARYSTLSTRVMVNLSQAQRLDTLSTDQVAGIGLLRSEWLLLDILDGRHPWHWVDQGQEAELTSRIVEQLEPILRALGPKPLRYRSLDLRSHEWQALVGSPPVESNPMLGLRGTLSYDVDARLFEVELAALATLQRAGYGQIQLILPFVRTVEEVMACRQPIVQAGLTDHGGFALWIMAEVPSVLFLLPAYAQAGVQGIAIGSNDLTQLLLAVDRDQPTLASAYDERHPVVRLAMAHLVREARRCGLACSICGQAPVRHPELIADLVAWGINSISVETAALPFTLDAVWQAEQGMKL
ncbi:MAG: putative PEP-binding protein [Nodosilinea sp.]